MSNLQSGFIPGDSCVNQLTYLYNFIAKAMDDGKEIRAVFCDISKAFDRVWHKGLVHKLRYCGIDGALLQWFESYLEHRSQRVVINGYSSNIKPVTAGVPQGSVLGPLLFLVYINDIVEGIESNIRLFADDTSIYVIIDDPHDAAECLNNDLLKIANWAKTWKVEFNPSKTKTILFSRRSNPVHQPGLFFTDIQIEEIASHKHLGLTLQNDCSWDKHIHDIIKRASPMVNCLRSLKYNLTRNTLNRMYTSFILPIFDYCSHIYDNCTKTQAILLENLHLDALRTICGAVRGTSHAKIYEETSSYSLCERRRVAKLITFFKMYNNRLPDYLNDLVPPFVSQASNYFLRNASNLQTIPCRTALYNNSFLPDTVNLWNALPESIKSITSLSEFKSTLTSRVKSIHFDLNIGSRRCQILHCRLRLGCSDLNADKFNRHILDRADCLCGHDNEDALHFFFVCPLFETIRANKFYYTNGFSLQTILCGTSSLNHESNSVILKSVHKFIIESKRFEN